MTLRRGMRIGALALGTAIAISGGADFATFAAAAGNSVGTLTFAATTGLNTTAIIVTTVSRGPNTGCPTGTSNVRALVNGPGGWTNIPVVSDTVSGMSTTSDFSEPFTDSFQGIAQRNGLTITAGRYDVSLLCQDGSGSTVYGTFDSPIFFTDATHYQSNYPIQVAATTTTLTASPGSPSVAGTSVAFTAAVSPAAAGTVQFKDGASNLGLAQPVLAGHATLTSTLPIGSHSVSAVFTPVDSTAFTGSTSATTISVVRAPVATSSTRTTVTASPGSPSVAGTSVAFTAAVSPAAAGTVQFKDGASNLGFAQPVLAGHATLTSTLPIGSHSVSAVFTPVDSTAFTGSTSPAITSIVAAAGQPVSVPAPTVAGGRSSRTAAGKPARNGKTPAAGMSLAAKGVSTWPPSAALGGLSPQLLPASALSTLPSVADQVTAAVPEPLIAADEKTAPARTPVASHAEQYTLNHNRHVDLLPAGLIVAGIAALFITGYARALRFLRGSGARR